MSKLNAAQRKALPLSDFGDPKRRLYPIVDQDDVDSAAHLIGKAADPEAVKARIISIAKRKGLKIPDAWQKKATMSALATFALEGVATGEEHGMVRRTALLLKPGDFPDHEWSITSQELTALAERFEGPGYVEIEHFQSHGKPSILDGHTGYLDGVWASEDGGELYGDLVLPEWLSEIADKNGGKVSSVVTRDDKELMGVGLVLEPAVPEAAMLSAFVDFAKRHDTPRGQYAMQDLHDSAVRHGAVCASGNVAMASKHESGAIQQVHDVAVSHGAKCDAVGARGNQGMMLYSKEDQTVPAEQKTVAELQAQLEAEKAQRETDRRALVTLQAERRVEKANALVDALITQNKVLPAEREQLVKLHILAATSDDTKGLVALSQDGKESQESLLATVVAALSARQVIGLTQEQIAANPKVTVLLNRQETLEEEERKKGTPEEADNLLSMTPLGKRALAAKRAANGK